MTDLIRLKKSLESSDVPYSEYTKPNYSRTKNYEFPEGSVVIKIIADNDIVIGYKGLYTAIYFNPDGSFICLGVWQ